MFVLYKEALLKRLFAPRDTVSPQNHFLNQAVSFPLLPSSVLLEHGAAASPADAKRWMSVIVCVMTECFNQVLCRARALSQFLFHRSITWPAAGRCSCFLPGDAGNTCPAQISSPRWSLERCATVQQHSGRKLSGQHFPARLLCLYRY